MYSHDSDDVLLNCDPRGGTQGAEPGSGIQRFWGPLEASEIRRLVSAIRGLGKGWLFRGLGEGCPFSKERGKKVGHSKAL